MIIVTQKSKNYSYLQPASLKKFKDCFIVLYFSSWEHNSEVPTRHYLYYFILFLLYSSIYSTGKAQHFCIHDNFY